MMNEKKDCFAWTERKCLALTIKDCENCKFYKKKGEKENGRKICR